MLVARPDEIRTFLSNLWFFEGSYLEVRLIPPEGGTVGRRFCSALGEAVQFAVQASGRANIYVGACPRFRRGGGRDDVNTVIAAWADIDFHLLGATDRIEAERIAFYRLEQLQLPATIVVHTGNGLQAWWLYDSPITLSDTRSAKDFEAINRGLARLLKGDAVHDIARVLRVPGTWNLPDARKRARGCVPVQARLIRHNGPVYPIAELQRYSERVHRTKKSALSKVSPLQASPAPPIEILQAFGRLLASLSSRHPLGRTWRGDRLLHDGSRSGWDMALVNQLLRVGVKQELVPAIVRAYPLGRGSDATDDYIARAIAKAAATIGGRCGA